MPASFTFEEATAPEAKSFSFEEASAPPKSFSFEEASRPPQTKEEFDKDTERLNRQEAESQFMRENAGNEASRQGLSEAVTEAKAHPGEAAMLPLDIASLPFSAASSALIGAVPEAKRKAALKRGGVPGMVEAGRELGSEIAPMLLPLGAAADLGKAGKAIGLGFGATTASQVPEAARQAGLIVGDPKKSTAEKVLTLGELGIPMTMAAMMLGVGAIPKPTSAETLARAIDKSPLAMKSVVEGARVLPKTAKAVVDTLVKKGEEHASPITSATSVPEPEVRPPVGQEAPLRQPGEAAPVQEQHAANVAPPKEAELAPEPPAPPEAAKVPETAAIATKEAAKSEITPANSASPIEAGEKPIVGMGGAVPSEFQSGTGTITSTKKAVVDQERAKRGLPPAVQPARKKFGEVWDRAMARIDQDPEWQDNLVDELRDHPRALTDEEDAALLQRQITLQNTYDKATRDLAQLYEDKTTDLIPQYQANLASIRDQLFDLYQIDKRAGTETGRGLAARKMLADEDFNLVKMEVESRAAKGGRPLTDAENAQIKKLHDEIKGWQERYDKHVAEAAEKQANIEAQLATERIKKMPSETKPIDPTIKRIADLVGQRLHTQADAARARIAARRGRLSAGVDPTALVDYAVIGADHIFNGLHAIGEWSAKMIEDLGEEIRPHLDEIWKAANKKFDSEVGQTALDKARAASDAIKKMTPEQKVNYLKDKIGAKIKGKKKDEITTLVQKLARTFVDMKPAIERDELIDAVHGVLTQIDPTITRSGARDMISGYGEFKQLSKDAISKRLRDLKGQMQQVSKLEDMQQRIPPSKTGLERRVPSTEEGRLIKLVNDAKREFQIPITDPNTQLKSSLDTLKAKMQSKAREYEDKLRNGDFNPRPKREIRLDSEAIRLKAQLERAKQDYYNGLVADRLKNRSRFEKSADALVKWSRGFLLSGPSTLAKLTAAAFWRMVQNPIEETAGAGLGLIPGIRQISERAPIEGGVNLRAEAKAITEGFMQGFTDAANTLKTGKSALDRVFGGPRDVGIGEETEAQKSVIDFFGHLHGALKAPVKRAAFARAFEKLTAFNLKNGVDVTDPLVQTRMAVQAYKRANMDIFMQSNKINNAWRAALRVIETKDKETGKVPVGMKALATAGRTLIPITKVPTNIVGEAMQYALGSLTGSGRVGLAFKDGIANLKPEEADLIMRQLKKGSIGAAIMLTGYFNPQMFGGFYQQGEKRKAGEVPYGGAKVGGTEIPRVYLHTPAMEAAQLGATVRRVADSKLRKKDKTTQGIGEGALAGALGLVDDVPFIGDMFQASKAMNPHERTQYFGDLAKSRIVPQMLSQTAEHFDKDAQGNPIKRKPETILQGVESGIPGLRQTLPVKK